MSTGIDDLNLYVPPTMLLSSDLKMYRDMSDKLIADSGFNSKSIMPCYEDVITLAVNAAMPIIKGHESDYELLIVATESGIDFGKPISSYIHKYLKLPTRCVNFEIKHACYSGTAALKMACSWVNQQSGDKKALVIMSDVARNHFGHSSEITLGNGAVALSISKNPRILKVDLDSGMTSREVYDVARPTNILEYGDINLSLASYLDLTEMSYSDFSTRHKITNPQDYFSYMLYHSPVISLVEKAHGVLMQEATSLNNEQITNDFKMRVKPTLRLNSYTGNLFSASVYASLLGLLNDLNSTPELPISIFSYGSGACSEFYQAYICSGAIDIIKRKDIYAMIDNRVKIDFATYEKLVKDQEHICTSQNYLVDYDQVNNVYKKCYLGKNLLTLNNIENYYRTYKFS